MAGTQFQIEVGVTGTSDVLGMSSALEGMQASLATASSAASAASAAVKAAEASYKTAEMAADGAAKAVERSTLAVETQAIKAAEAAAVYGTSSTQFARATDKLAALVERQQEATTAADAAKQTLAEQAIRLDGLRVAAIEAAAAEGKLGESIDAANKSQKAQVDAVSKAKKALEDQNKARADALKQTQNNAKEQQKANIEMAKGLAKIAAVSAVVAAAILAAGAAAVVGIAKIAMWAIELADTNKLIPKQLDRIKKSFTKLFSGLKIDKIVTGLEQVGDLFDENASSAKAIKAVFESLFQPLVDGVANIIPMLIRGFLQFQILVLKALIAIKEATGKYSEEISTLSKGFAIMLVVGAAVVALIVGVIIVALVALAVAFAAAAYSAALFYDEVVGAIEWFKKADFAAMGMAIIDGIVNGITNGASSVIKAITGVADGAINAAKKALGIASPSKVFAEIGGFTAEGMQEGVEGGSAGVTSALEGMTSPPALTAAPAAAAEATTSSSSGGISIQGGLTIHTAATDGKSFAQEFLGELERIALRGGGAPA